MKRRHPISREDEASADVAEGEPDRAAATTTTAPSLVSRLRGLEHTAKYARLGMREGQTTITVPGVADPVHPYPLLGDGHLHDPATGDVVDEDEANRMPGHAGFVAVLQARQDVIDRDPDVQLARLVQGHSHNRAPLAFLDEQRMHADTARAAALVAKGVEARQKAATAGPGKKTEVLQAARALLNAAVIERDQAINAVATPIDEAFRTLHLERFTSVVPLPATEGSKALALGTGYLFPYYWRYQYRLARRLLDIHPEALGDLAAWPALMREMIKVYAYDRDVIFSPGWTAANARKGPQLAQDVVAAIRGLDSVVYETMTVGDRNRAIILFVQYVVMRDALLRRYGPETNAVNATATEFWLPRAAGNSPFLVTNRYLGGWLMDTLVRAIQHMRQVLPWACAPREAPLGLGNAHAPAARSLARPYKKLFDMVDGEYDEPGFTRDAAMALASGQGTLLVHTEILAADERLQILAPAVVRYDTIDAFYRAYVTSADKDDDGPWSGWHNDRVAAGPGGSAEDVLLSAYADVAVNAPNYSSLGIPGSLEAYAKRTDDEATAFRSELRTAMVGTAARLFSVSPVNGEVGRATSNLASLLPTLSHYEWACTVLDGILSPVLVAAARRLFTVDYASSDGGADQQDAVPFQLHLPSILPRVPKADAESRIYRGLPPTSELAPPGIELPAKHRTGDLLKIVAYASDPLLGAGDARIFNTLTTPGVQAKIGDFLAATRTETNNNFLRFERQRWATMLRAQGAAVELTDEENLPVIDVTSIHLGRYVIPALMGEFGRRLRDELAAAVFDPGLGDSTALRAPVEIRPRPMSRAVQRTRALRQELDDLIDAFQQLVDKADTQAAGPEAEQTRSLVKPLLSRIGDMLKKAFAESPSASEAAAQVAGGAAAATLAPNPLFVTFLQSARRLPRYLASDKTLFARMEGLSALDPDDDRYAGRMRARRLRYAFWLNNTVGERDAVDHGMQWPKLFLFLDYVRFVFSDAALWDARVDQMERLVAELERQWEVLAKAELLDRSVARLAQDFYVPTVGEQMHPTITGRMYMTPTFSACLDDALNRARELIDPALTLEYLTSPHAGQGRVRGAFAKFVAATDQYFELHGPTGYLREKQFSATTRNYQDAFTALRTALSDDARGGGGGGRGPTSASAAARPLFTII